MSGSNPSDELLGKRIRTLTSILHRFKVQKSPSKQPKDILPFLSHFTTLLTYGDERQAKRFVAVTGSIDANNQVRTLIVCQNTSLTTTVKSISLELVDKDKRSLDDVVKGSLNPPFHSHVADVLAALFAFTRTPGEPDYADQVRKFELFFFSRSYWKFVTRFREDHRLCQKRRLFEVIADWQPDLPEIAAKWVSPPKWLLDFGGLPPIRSRVVQGEVEWEFSDGTKKAWSKILEILLRKVDKGIEEVRTTRVSRKKAHEEGTAMATLNTWCRVLYHFVTWDAGIVKSLLTGTNMVDSISTAFTPMRTYDPADETGDDDDDAADFLQEPGESKGEQVYRYLKTVIAWHHAVFRLCRDARISKLLENIQIGIVEVPPSPTSVLTLNQISDEFFARFPDMTVDRDQVSNALTKHHPDTFYGCVHAEATLMGLINYYAHEKKYQNHGVAVMNVPHMRSIAQPVADAGSAVISVSKKCCWCCDWLGRRLETQFKLPGTHGIMYPWDPPMIGISETILQQLENVLWNELHRAVSNLVSPSYSRQSSEASSPGGTMKEHMEIMVPEFNLNA